MNLKLTENVLSPQDLRSAILEIHGWAKWFSHNAIKKRVSNRKSHLEEPVLSPAAADLIKQGLDGKEATGPRLDKIIRDLENFEESADHITITLAEAPSGGIKKNLTAWCRQNIDANLLITFEFNSTILGGMVLNRGSRIYDWSFRRRILEDRAKFPEVLRRV